MGFRISQSNFSETYGGRDQYFLDVKLHLLARLVLLVVLASSIALVADTFLARLTFLCVPASSTAFLAVFVNMRKISLILLG